MYGLSLEGAHGDVAELGGVLELALHSERVSVGTDVERAAGYVAVFGSDHARELLHRHVVGFETVRVGIHMDLTLGSAGDRHCADTVDTCQRIGYVLVEYLVESRETFRRLHRQQADRNHIGRELEDDGILRIVGEHRFHHVQFVPDIVGERVDVVSVFEFESYHRSVLARCGGDMLEVLHRVECVLERFGHILLDILRTRSRVHRDHHDGVGVDVRIEVDRKFRQREETQNDHCHEHKERGDRAFYRRTV